MKKMICFDMDGTIADLYAVNGWLEMLRAENPMPYILADPMWNMTELRTVLMMLKDQNWEIRIITWLSMDSSEEYKELVRMAKINWLKAHDFPFDHFHGVQYGATKFDSIRRAAPDYAILVDDNEKVRDGWAGDTIDPTNCDLIAKLIDLLN